MGGKTNRVLNFLFPPLCIACREPVGEAGGFCADCWRDIAFLDGPACGCCGVPFPLDPGSETLCAACLASPPSYDKAPAFLPMTAKSVVRFLYLNTATRWIWCRVSRAGWNVLVTACWLIAT